MVILFCWYGLKILKLYAHNKNFSYLVEKVKKQIINFCNSYFHKSFYFNCFFFVIVTVYFFIYFCYTKYNK